MSKDGMDNEIDDIFKQALEGEKIEPPEEFWYKASENIVSGMNKPVGKIGFPWKVIALALMALVFVLSSLVFYFYKQNSGRSIVNEYTNSNKAINANSSVVADKLVLQNANEQPNNSNTRINRTESDLTTSTLKAKTGNEEVASANSNKAHTIGIKKVGSPKLVSKADQQAEVVNIQNSYKVSSPQGTNQKSAVLPNKQPIASNISGNNINEPASNTNAQVQNMASVNSLQNGLASLSGKNMSIDILPIADLALGTIQPINTNNVSNTSCPYSVSVYFSPDIISKNSFANNSSYNDINSKQLNEGEKTEFSYSAGIKGGFDVSSHLSVSVGLSYHVSSFNFIPQEVYYQKQSDGSTDYAVITSSGVVDCPYYGNSKAGDSLFIKGTSSREYVGVPIQFKYVFGIGYKLSWYITAGASVNVATNQVTTMHWQDTWQHSGNATVNGIENISSIYYSYYVGLGLAYKVHKNLSIYVEPNIQGGITPINKTAPIVFYPYSASLAVGVLYHF